MVSSLGHLAATVTLDIDPFKRNSNALKSMIKANTAALKAQETAVKNNSGSVTSMKAAYSTMETQMKNLTALLEKQKDAYDKASKKVSENNAEQDKAITRQANAASQMNRTSAQIEVLKGKMEALKGQIALQSSSWNALGQKLDNFANKTQNASQKLNSIGNTMSATVTAPIVAGLGYATNAAIKFNSEIEAMGPLLTNGGAITASVNKELNKLGDASIKWSKEFGISTSSINAGMTEMIKRGYTANQTLGAMPSVLNAAKASGDDFNEVMTVSSSILEQFGLKVNTTNGMLKNTQRVTDTLTYIANATASDFHGLGEAMQYVGPSAAMAGISLEEAASACGILSNRGLDGTVAGTALRGALTRMLKPSKQNAEGFKKLGINIEDFKNGAISLPEILDKINKNTKNWNSTQRASAIAMAVGTEAQAGFNSLVAAGGDELRAYTKKAQEASGVTARVADKLNNTEAAKVAKFKQAVNALSIEFGQKLLPTLTPLIEDLTDLINNFSKLDSSTQQNIIKMGLFAAAIGPVSKILGVTVGTVSVASKGLASLAKMFAKAEVASIATSAGLNGLSTSMVASTATTGALATGAESVAIGFSAINPAVAAAGVAILAGVAVWKLATSESAERVRMWGSDVGSSNDKALKKFQDTSVGVSQALTDMNVATKTTTSEMSKSFDKEFQMIEKNTKNHLKEVKNALKGIDVDSYTKSTVTEWAKDKQKDLDNFKNQAEEINQEVQTILKTSNGKISELSAEQRTILYNNQQKMLEMEIQSLNISSDKKKAIIAALNGDIENMTKNQRYLAINELQDQVDKEYDVQRKQLSKLKKLYEEGTLTKKEYNALVDSTNQKTQRSIDSIGASYVRLAEANGESIDRIKYNLSSMGASYENITQIIKEQDAKNAKSMSLTISTAGEMSKATKKAVDSWNSMVFDKKTGEVKTNVQEEVTKAVKNAKTWNQIKLLEKKGKLSTNAKAMVAEALIETGKWDKLSLKEKKAWFNTNASQTMFTVLNEKGKWDKLDLKVKKAIIESQGLGDLAKAITQYNLWNDIPVKVKKLLAKDESASKTLRNAGYEIDLYNGKSIPSKILKGDSSSIENASQRGIAAVFNYKNTNAGEKNLKAKDNASGPANSASNAVDRFNQKKDHKVTLTTVWQTITETITGKKHAKGTNSAPGGPSILGDGGRPEPFLMPNGAFGVSPSTDTLINLQRGTKVWPSIPAFERDIARFSVGTTNNRRLINNLATTSIAPKETATTLSINTNNNMSDTNTLLKMQNDLLRQIVNLLVINKTGQKSQSNRELLRDLSQKLNTISVQDYRGRLS